MNRFGIGLAFMLFCVGISVLGVAEPGLAQIVWSDGERSLTWLPGVRLMWMASETHLMCGRGGHKH